MMVLSKLRTGTKNKALHSVLAAIVVNPNAAGGYICQYKNDAKKLNND